MIYISTLKSNTLSKMWLVLVSNIYRCGNQANNIKKLICISNKCKLIYSKNII